MKKTIWALILGAIAVFPAYAEEPAFPAASGDEAVDNAKIEEYMEQAVEKQLEAMRSTLPMKVSAGVVWKDLELSSDTLKYVYQIDIDEMVKVYTAVVPNGFSEKDKEDLLKRMKSEICPKIKPMLCASLELMNTFSPKLQQIKAGYQKANGEQFTDCVFSLQECKELASWYDQSDFAAE